MSGCAADRLRQYFEADSFAAGEGTRRAGSMVESPRDNDRRGVEGRRGRRDATQCDRGTDVDRLSEEEAGIIAARLVRRVQTKTELPKDKAEGLQLALTDALRKKLTGDRCGPNEKQSSLEDAASKYLDQEQTKVLKEA